MTDAPNPFLAGLQGKCPQCGRGSVFASYLKFGDRCAACGADFRIADAGDGPIVFVILIVGAMVVPLLIILQFGLDLPEWLSLGLTFAATIALCLTLLPIFKATLFALQWKHKAREVRPEDLT
jgi:uncharacterized protein (DUF983 family)